MILLGVSEGVDGVEVSDLKLAVDDGWEEPPLASFSFSTYRSSSESESYMRPASSLFAASCPNCGKTGMYDWGRPRRRVRPFQAG